MWDAPLPGGGAPVTSVAAKNGGASKRTVSRNMTRGVAFCTCASKSTLLPRQTPVEDSASGCVLEKRREGCTWRVPTDAVHLGLDSERVGDLFTRAAQGVVSSTQRSRALCGAETARTANLKNFRKNFFSSRPAV